MATWRKLIVAEMVRQGEGMSDTVGWAVMYGVDEDQGGNKFNDVEAHSPGAPNDDWGWLDLELRQRLRRSQRPAVHALDGAARVLPSHVRRHGMGIKRPEESIRRSDQTRRRTVRGQ